MTMFKDVKWDSWGRLDGPQNEPVYDSRSTSATTVLFNIMSKAFTPNILKKVRRVRGRVVHGQLETPAESKFYLGKQTEGKTAQTTEWVYKVWMPLTSGCLGRPKKMGLTDRSETYLDVHVSNTAVGITGEKGDLIRIPNDSEVVMEFNDLGGYEFPMIVEVIGQSPITPEMQARSAGTEGGPGGSSRNAYNGSDCQYTGPTNTGTNCSEAGVKQGPISKVKPRLSYSELDSLRSAGVFNDLMTYIASKEGGYNSVNRGDGGDSRGGAKDYVGKDLTSMTVTEVGSYQMGGSKAHLVKKSSKQEAGTRKVGFLAVGKYQWIPDTYRGTVRGLGLRNSNRQFSSTTQDTMGLYLLLMKRPKLGSYLLGLHNNECEAGQDIAREWASFPVQYAEGPAKRGQSRYVGSANNRSGHPPEEVIEKLRAARHSFAQWDRSKALLADKGYTAEPGTPGSEPAPSPSCDQASNASGPSAPGASEGSAPRVSGGSRILLIGDSQMAGTTLSREIKRDLEKQGAQEVKILAKPTRGLFVKADFWTIESPSGLVQTTLKNFKPNLVIVGLGGNDSYGYGQSSKKEIYEARVRKWVNVIQGAGSQVIWLGPSHASKVDSSGIPYDRYRQKIREHQQGVLGSLSIPWHNMKNLTEDLEKSDGVHFTTSSYRQWAARLLSGPLSGVRSSLSEGASV